METINKLTDNVVTATDNNKHTINSYESFDDMGLQMKLLRGIYAYGFEKPSKIQKLGIIPITKGYDVIGQSQSGTGKTGTFLIGALQKIDSEKKELQVLILAPTRELSQQILSVCNNLCNFMNLQSYLLIGGNSRHEDIRNLDKNQYQIIVGTPGRIYDMLKNKSLKPKQLKLFIIDEADEMLSFGFQDQIYEIFQYVPNKCQICLFSATMPEEALELTNKFMNDPVKILVKKEELTLEGIKQFYIAIEKEIWKLDTLCDIYKKLSVSQSIIYCNTKRTSDWLKEELQERDFTTECIHGNMNMQERKDVMNQFRKGDLRVLIATDIISRGIDVQQVGIVINYDIPKYKEVYIHRIGRSGRYGRKGVTINFVTYEDVSKLKLIQEYYETQIEQMPDNISEFL